MKCQIRREDGTWVDVTTKATQVIAYVTSPLDREIIAYLETPLQYVIRSKPAKFVLACEYGTWNLELERFGSICQGRSIGIGPVIAAPIDLSALLRTIYAGGPHFDTIMAAMMDAYLKATNQDRPPQERR